MTITPDTALGGDLEFLTDSEARRADELRADSAGAISLTEAGLAIGGAFLFYRLWMVKRLRREVRVGITPVQLAAATEYHFRKFLPIWSYVSVPALVRAMILGSPDKQIPDELIYAMADDYARRIGGYINDTSKEALLEGFNAHLNKRQNRVAAANKAIDGFGLTKRQTRALVAKKDRPPVASTRHIPVDRDRELYIESSVFSRALTVGDNEAYGATQHGKQIGWMYLQREGRISSDAKRVWVTARDEKTCKVCGPMHRKTAKIDEPFETPQGEVWAPYLHPNCRCTMTLRGLVKSQFTLAKDLYGAELAEFNRKVRRSDDGRFSFKPDLKEAEIDPQVADMVAQANKLAPVEDRVQIPDRVNLGARVNLSNKVSLGQKVDLNQRVVSLPKTDLPKHTLPKLTLTPEKIQLLEQKAKLLPAKVTLDRADLNRPRANPAPKSPEHKDLGYEASHFDGANALFPIHDPVQPADGRPVVFTGDQAFYDPDTTAEQIEVGFEQMAERMVNKFVRHGTVRDETTGARLHLSPETVKRLTLAALRGDQSIDVQTWAEAVGFRRENHSARIYHVREVYPDAQFPAEGYVVAPGPYVVEDVMQIAGRGYPIEHVYLRPMTVEEYQEWYDQREHK